MQRSEVGSQRSASDIAPVSYAAYDVFVRVKDAKIVREEFLPYTAGEK
jgi:hypothetical protein